MKSEITDFGFNFGSIEVTRTHIDNLASVISVQTPKNKFSVRATKTGNLRFYDENGGECELVAKGFIDQLENKAVPINDHPLKDEIISKVKSGEIIFS